ncbi:ABC transporter permease [Candidatus Bipolaricaulota bacterium]|nr:ABC transporter permease [Candidatus Bipolaricaulota bacterium]
MLSYTLRRLIQLIGVLFAVTVLLFLILKMAPGDPARIYAGMTASEDTVEAIRRDLGLNKPWYVQYYRFISGFFTGNSRSMTYRTPVREIILERAPASIELGAFALIITLIVSIPIGIISAVKRNSVLDYGLTVLALAGVSMPVFWTALMMMIVAGVWLDILPVSGRGELVYGWSFLTLDGLRYMIIPGLALASVQIAMNVRLIRSSMLEVLQEDYITTARSKGLKESVVIIVHAFKNALMPVLTNLGIQLSRFLAGAVLTETVVAWPGLGRLIYESVTRRDQPLLFGLTLLMAIGFLLSYLVVDILYSFVDPRITYD